MKHIGINLWIYPLVGGFCPHDFLLSERALLATSDRRSRAKLARTRKNLAFFLKLMAMGELAKPNLVAGTLRVPSELMQRQA